MPMRWIARLEIKDPFLVKGVHFEGFRRMGEPDIAAKEYYSNGADELLFLDTVASLYGRSFPLDLLRRAAADLFIPITVSGGVRSLEDAQALLRAGADKIAVNSAAIQNPELVSLLARSLGSQSVVLSIEASRRSSGGWESLYHFGRERSGLDAVEWARRGESLGAGEILLTSVDRDGTQQGFDCELLNAVRSVVNIPVIFSGGLGALSHLEELRASRAADAIAVGSFLHYRKGTFEDLRRAWGQ